MIDFEQWYEQEIGSENKPEYEAAKWAWEYQQKKLDCCREENKALLIKLSELKLVAETHNNTIQALCKKLNDILKVNKDEK